MLKTVSSVANALGALNYKGTWDASINTPTLASGVGTQGDYYVVSVAGATDLDGITNWGVGDWAAFNGSVWQRVEGGADGNFVNLEVTGSALIGTTTANTTYAPRLYTESALGDGNGGILIGSYKPSATFLDFSGGTPAVHRIANDGGNLYFETDTNQDGTFDTVGAHFTSVGNLAFASGKGIDFSATAGTGTSELLDDYEEGVYTPTLGGMSGGTVTYTTQTGIYTKVGRQVTVYFKIVVNTNTNTGGNTFLSVPFSASTGGFVGPLGINTSSNAAITHVSFFASGTQAYFYTAGGGTLNGSAVVNGSQLQGSITYFV